MNTNYIEILERQIKSMEGKNTNQAAKDWSAELRMKVFVLKRGNSLTNKKANPYGFEV